MKKQKYQILMGLSATMLLSVHAQAQSQPFKYLLADCHLQRPEAKSYIREFRLQITGGTAKVWVAKENQADSFEGTVKLSNRTQTKDTTSPDQEALVTFVGFNDLVADYKISLSVAKSILLEDADDRTDFAVHMIGRGEALYSEDYVCHSN